MLLLPPNPSSAILRAFSNRRDSGILATRPTVVERFYSVDSFWVFVLNGVVGKKGINQAAVSLGQLSGWSRRGRPEGDAPQLTKEQRHAAAVTLGRLGGQAGGRAGGLAGGKVGGLARAKKLDAAARRAVAVHAAKVRWAAR